MSERLLQLGVPAMPLEGGASGIGVYIRQQIKALSHSQDIKLTVFGFDSEREILDLDSQTRFVAVPEVYKGVTGNLFWHTSILPVQALLHRLNVLFLPAGNRRMSPEAPLGRYKVIATVHDLAPFHMPEKYGKSRTLYVTRWLPRMWRQATKIISVSDATRNDLLMHAGVDSKRISVVHNGVDHSAFQPRNKSEARQRLSGKLDLPEPFILYVARLEHPGKNHVGLLRGYARLLQQHPDLSHHLVFCGKDWNGAADIYREVKQLGLSSRVRFCGMVSDELLPYVYNASDLLAFPSLFEGFGIPAIEAMASGIPVVASNRTSLPEVVGDAGRLFDPQDERSIATALEIGLFDEDFRKAAKKNGPERAASFSWQRSTQETLRILMQ